ncbi:MAG: T9SS type A sorting domain-containing protein [Calditrichaceae bacterium]|nr:T9SS type A sorting domain-containing protein [Calditrichaceae bacterium]HES59488.1 T9SS type A sorting domain-containing protein [Caldithrix sp.]
MNQLQLAASGGDAVVTAITVDPATNGFGRNRVVDNEILVYLDKNKNGVVDAVVDQLLASRNYSERGNSPIGNPVSVTIPNAAIGNGTTQNWLVIHNFTGAADGAAFRVDITGVTLTAGSVSGLPVTGNTRTVETNSSSRNVSLFTGEGGKNPIARNVSESAVNEVMLQVVLAASTLKSTTISQIDFDMSGSGHENTDLTRARLFLDGDANGVLNLEQDTQIGSSVTEFDDDGALSFSGLNRVVEAGEFEHWMVVYDFNGAAAYNETFAVTLTANTDITASGATVSGAPVNGNPATISLTGSLMLSEGPYNPTARTISASESEFEMIQINLAANATENINISEISFKTSGTADESTDITSALLIRDANNNGRYDIVYDSQIGSAVSSFTDDGLITFTGLSEVITAGNSEKWILMYNLNGNGSPDETFKAYFDDPGQVIATGVSSSESISPLGLPVNGNTMTISQIGTLTLALADNNPGDVSFGGSAPDLTMLAFTMTANDVEDIYLTSIRVMPETNNLRRSNFADPDVRIYQDMDENGLLDINIDRFITSATYGGTGNGTPQPVTISVSGESIPASSTVQWLIINSISSSSAGNYAEVSVLSSDISGSGAVSLEPANITGSNLVGGKKTHVTGTPGTLTFTAGANNPEYRYISAGVQNEVMIQFQLAADPVENINITQISVAMTGTGDDLTDIVSARLYLDGDNNGLLNTLYDTQLGVTTSPASDNDTITFYGFTETISSGLAKNYIVVYNFNSANNELNETFQLYTGNALISAAGVTSGLTIIPTGGPIYGGQATITNTGTIDVSAGPNNPGNTNITNTEGNVVTIQLNVAAGGNEDVTVSAFTFRLSGTFDDGTDFAASAFQLYIDDNNNGALDSGEPQLDGNQTCFSDNGFVTFTGFSEHIQANTNKNYILLTSLNGNASNFENFRVSFVNSTDITATGDNTGNPVYANGVPVQGGLFTIGATGSLTLSLGTNTPPAGTESNSAANVEMLQMKLTASGVEAINISQIIFTASGTGHDRNDVVNNSVRLYRDNNDDGLLDAGDTQLGTGLSFSGDDGTVTFNLSGVSIPAGSYQNWLLVLSFDGSAANGVTFRAGIYNAAQITSTGATSGNPITETGFPMAGNYKTISAVGSMAIYLGDYNPGVSDINEQYHFEMLQFKLNASTLENIQVDSITITHQGTGDPEGTIMPEGVRLVRDVDNNGVYDSGTDNILAAANYSGIMATFTLSSVIISASTTENWLVIYDFYPPLMNGETYQTRIVNLTDISLTGVTSAMDIIPEGSVPLAGGTKTVNDDYSLPVELVSFTAKGDYGFIELNWETASEIDNLGFEVERKGMEDDNYESIASYKSSPELKGLGSVSYSTAYIYRDSSVIPEKEYSYRLIQYDYNGAFEILTLTPSATAKEPLPAEFKLMQNYPNPFNGETTIRFALPKNAEVSLVVFNALGQKIKTILNNKPMEAGYYNYKWNGTNNSNFSVASGLYFYQLTGGNTRIVKRMVYTK